MTVEEKLKAKADAGISSSIDTLTALLLLEAAKEEISRIRAELDRIKALVGNLDPIKVEA